MMKIRIEIDESMMEGEAEICLEVSFAGVELFIPKSWKVISQSDVSFAGIEEKKRNESTGSPVVYLTGEVSFSGVTMIYI